MTSPTVDPNIDLCLFVIVAIGFLTKVEFLIFFAFLISEQIYTIEFIQIV